MNRSNKLASLVTGAVAVAMLVGTSAFAEDRPANETGRERTRIERNRDASSSSRSQAQQQRNNGSEWRRQQQSQQQSEQPTQAYRNNNNGSSYDRRNGNSNGNDRRYDNNNNSNRNDNRNRYDNNNSNRYDNRNNNRYDSRNDRNRSYGRNDNRNYGYNNNRSYDRYDRSRPQYYSGRVSRYERYGSGYRVWISGAPFPFFLPEIRFRAFPIRVGISLRLGGYYNPGGYYDYYDAGPVSGAYTNGDLRGVVESVDYRNGTFVIHDDLSGDFVTAVMRTRDRLMDDLRPGDYVELSGAWTRGVFEAYRVAGIDTGAYRR